MSMQKQRDHYVHTRQREITTATVGLSQLCQDAVKQTQKLIKANTKKDLHLSSLHQKSSTKLNKLWQSNHRAAMEMKKLASAEHRQNQRFSLMQHQLVMKSMNLSRLRRVTAEEMKKLREVKHSGTDTEVTREIKYELSQTKDSLAEMQRRTKQQAVMAFIMTVRFLLAIRAGCCHFES